MNYFHFFYFKSIVSKKWYNPLKNFVLYCTKKSTELLALKSTTQFYHISVFSFELFTIFWCNSSLIMVQLSTNFSNQQISASFLCNIEQNFSQCRTKNFELKEKKKKRQKKTINANVWKVIHRGNSYVMKQFLCNRASPVAERVCARTRRREVPSQILGSAC